MPRYMLELNSVDENSIAHFTVTDGRLRGLSVVCYTQVEPDYEAMAMGAIDENGKAAVAVWTSALPREAFVMKPPNFRPLSNTVEF